MSDVQLWEVKDTRRNRVWRSHQVQSNELGVGITAQCLARTLNPKFRGNSPVVPHDAFFAGRHAQLFMTAPLLGCRNLRIGCAAANIAAGDISLIADLIGGFGAAFAGLAIFLSVSRLRIAGVLLKAAQTLGRGGAAFAFVEFG